MYGLTRRVSRNRTGEVNGHQVESVRRIAAKCENGWKGPYDPDPGPIGPPASRTQNEWGGAGSLPGVHEMNRELIQPARDSLQGGERLRQLASQPIDPICLTSPSQVRARLSHRTSLLSGGTSGQRVCSRPSEQGPTLLVRHRDTNARRDI